MKISSVKNYSCTTSFGRKLKTEEKPQYTKALNDALNYLEVDNLACIVHGSSFPALGRDTQIGSPYGKGADKFVDFLKLHGFNGVQLGPGGTIGKKDPSPYISKVFAKNEMFIDMAQLKSDKYANILSDETYKEVTKEAKSTGKNYAMTDFNKAFNNYEIALDESYKNFKAKLEKDDKKAVQLNKEFENFKTRSNNWLEQDGIYKVLAKANKGKEFAKWDSELDKNLMNGIKNNDKTSLDRYEEIKSIYADEIEKNSFIQFIADKQLKESNKNRKEIGFNYVGDLLVGFADSDVWANQDAFLTDWKLGCPFGGAGNGPQAWGIPVLDPKKLFKSDGSLDVAGKLLKNKVAYSLQNYDNVRVDHALGLVDPYIYKENSIIKNHDGSIRRENLHANNVSYLREVDPNGNFRKVLSKIVLPTFEEYGVDKNEAVWEDLCSETSTFQEVYRGQEHLPGITQTEWRRAENSPKNNWSLVGSHDSKPAKQMMENSWLKDSDAWNVDYLSGFLNPDPKKANEKQAYKDKIVNSPVEHVKAKFTELFRGSKNIQMMFVDLLGIDKVYNYGGQAQPTNWKLRVNSDFEDTYHKALETEGSYALNMPEILGKAVRAKADMEVAKLSYDEGKANAKRTELDKKLKPLLDKLDGFKNILKEKETETVKPEPKTQAKAEKIEEKAEPKVEAKTETKADKPVDTVKPVSNPIESVTAPKKDKAEDKKTKDSAAATTLAITAGIALLYKIGSQIVKKFKRKKAEVPPQPVLNQTVEANKTAVKIEK